MANGERVTPPATIVRYAKPVEVQGENEVSGSIFHRKPGEDGVSVCRLGLLYPNARDADLAEVRAILNAHRKLKPKGRLAEFKVADIEAVGEEIERVLRVIEDAIEAVDGKPANPAHALIEGLPFMDGGSSSLFDVAVGDLLAARLLDLHPAM